MYDSKYEKTSSARNCLIKTQTPHHNKIQSFNIHIYEGALQNIILNIIIMGPAAVAIIDVKSLKYQEKDIGGAIHIIHNNVFFI